MRIALDAMGGDHAPGIPVEGALAALDEFGTDLSIILVGRSSGFGRSFPSTAGTPKRAFTFRTRRK